jgi:hypothetical protein
MKDNFVVLGIGNSGRKFPLATSKNQSRAIGYANMCKSETSIKPCSDVEVLKYMESFYILNLD